jgi:RNA polymerase sigma-70 factor (ECF subfamily)
LSSAEARFAALFEGTHLPLLAYAVRRVADPADAADVVAETFLIAWRRLDDVPTDDGARPWLFGVARRVLANHYRGERRRHALADRLRDALIDVVTPASGVRTTVELALRRLADDDQELLQLVAWEQLARDEIAVVLGISRAAVRVRLHRARQRLTKAMRAVTAEIDAESEAAGVRRAAPVGHVSSGWVSARPGLKEGS